MKTIKTFAAAIALTTASFTTFAAEHVSAQDAAQFEKAGVIVASGATDLSSLEVSAGRQSRCRRRQGFHHHLYQRQ